MMAPTQGSGGAMRSTNLKPGPITRAVVITLRDVHADKVLGASPGTYTALGNNLDLPRGLADAQNVEVIAADNLQMADDAVKEAVGADPDALVLCSLVGPGNWDAFHAKPEDLGDGFPLPPQSSGDGSAIGIAMWAARSRARVDKRRSLNDKTKPGEGAVTLTQLAEEVLSKVGFVANFGA